jgi:cytochrome c
VIRRSAILVLPLALAACGGPKDGTGTGPATSEAATETVALSGEAIFSQCSACHSIDKGGRNGVGPNLHGVVGRAVGSVDGFAYSAALKAKGGNWDAASLDSFITDPRATVTGTKMAFVGVKDATQRKALIEYLSAQK